uniref:Uncharacterized protein n=1 Tax=Phasianus colchicus TaxID=9054 RepID=A0A669QYF1_PHACC
MVQLIISSAGAGSLERWVLVELQGEVEPRGGGALPGSLLGDLHYTRELGHALKLAASSCSLLKSPLQPAELQMGFTTSVLAPSPLESPQTWEHMESGRGSRDDTPIFSLCKSLLCQIHQDIKNRPLKI